MNPADTADTTETVDTADKDINNLEAQPIDSAAKKSLFTVRNIIIGSAGVLLLLGGSYAVYNREKLFGSAKKSTTVTTTVESNKANVDVPPIKPAEPPADNGKKTPPPAPPPNPPINPVKSPKSGGNTNNGQPSTNPKGSPKKKPARVQETTKIIGLIERGETRKFLDAIDCGNVEIAGINKLLADLKLNQPDAFIPDDTGKYRLPIKLGKNKYVALLNNELEMAEGIFKIISQTTTHLKLDEDEFREYAKKRDEKNGIYRY